MVLGSHSVHLDRVDVASLKIMEPLGSGGFGSVYSAIYSGERVAVKVTHQKPVSQKSLLESVVAEMEASQLKHENIVKVLGVCLQEKVKGSKLPMLVMEFAGRRDLQRVLEDPREGIDFQRRMRFASDITRALAYAHSRDFLHLDVKPSNVIVTDQDTCKLADFGCSQLAPEKADPPTPTKSSLTGTFAYRAPELLRGRSPTNRADVYSLAICLWQLLSRDRPYGYEEHQIVIFAVVAYNHRPDFTAAMLEAETKEEEDAVASYRDLAVQSWCGEPEQRPDAATVLTRLSAIADGVLPRREDG